MRRSGLDRMQAGSPATRHYTIDTTTSSSSTSTNIPSRQPPQHTKTRTIRTRTRRKLDVSRYDYVGDPTPRQGINTALVVRGNSLDMTVSQTLPNMVNDFWCHDGKGKCFAEQVKACSGGKLQYVPAEVRATSSSDSSTSISTSRSTSDSNTSTSTSTTNNGIVTVHVNDTFAEKSRFQVMNLIVATLQEQYDMTIDELHSITNLLLLVPSDVNFGFDSNAFAPLNGGIVVFKSNSGPKLPLQMVRTVLYCTILYCTVLYCIVLYCTSPS